MAARAKRSIVAAAGETPWAQRTSGLAALGRPENARQVAARAVQVRLDDLQHEARRARGVERIAAALEHGHPGRVASQCVEATAPNVPRSSGRS